METITTICITGCAASGKSTIVQKLQNDLREITALDLIVLPETATELLQAGFSSSSNKLLFQRKLFQLQLAKELVYRNYVLETRRPALLLLDRSALDGKIYLEPSEFESILLENNITVNEILKSIDIVIQLAPAPAYNREKNNAYRLESSVDEILEQDRDLKRVYSVHPNYHYIESTVDFQEKYDRVLKIIEDYQSERISGD